MKRQVEFFKGQKQEAGPDVARTTTGSSGYADFPGTSPPSSPQEGEGQLASLAENPSEQGMDVNIVVVNGSNRPSNGEGVGFANAMFGANGGTPSPVPPQGGSPGSDSLGREVGASERSGIEEASAGAVGGNAAAPYMVCSLTTILWWTFISVEWNLISFVNGETRF